MARDATTRKASWTFAGVVALTATPASASPAALAAGIQSFLAGLIGVGCLLALVIGGYFYLTGRGSLQSLIPAVIGILMLLSIGAITAAVIGGSPAALAGLFLGWLRAGVWVVLGAVLVIIGYMYWFGRGSYQMLIPVVTGLLIILSADWILARMGG